MVLITACSLSRVVALFHDICLRDVVDALILRRVLHLVVIFQILGKRLVMLSVPLAIHKETIVMVHHKLVLVDGASSLSLIVKRVRADI